MNTPPQTVLILPTSDKSEQPPNPYIPSAHLTIGNESYHLSVGAYFSSEDITPMSNWLRAKMSGSKDSRVVERLPKDQTMQLKSPTSWGIQGTKLNLGEISTSVLIVKHCGSIFSQCDNNSFLDDIKIGFDIHI